MTDNEEYLASENARLRSLLKQAGLNAEASDIANKLQRLLLRELHHRIKNLLAMVQSIVTQSLRAARSPGDAAEAINQRIAALARTHDIILSTAGEDSPLRPLLEAITEPFGSRRFKIDVPDAEIGSKTAIGLALVFNELSTNAIKYGSLSVPEGSVNITGRLDAKARELVVTWVESGGPPVKPPTKKSFGTKLMQAVLPNEPKLEYRPSGVVCELMVPAPLDENA